MSDDKLLHALGREAGRQEGEAQRWEDLAANDRPARGASDQDELARRLFTPPSDAFVDQVTGKVLDLVAREGKRGATVTPLRPRGLRWAGLALAPVAAAAAIALFAARPGATLPAYTLTVSGGVRDTRGAETSSPAEPLAVAPGSQVVLIARPDARASESVHAATFLLRSGVTVPVPSASEVSEKGALRVTVLGDELVRAAAGTGDGLDLVLVVGLSPGLERHASTATDESSTPRRDWARFSIPIRVPASGR